MIQLQILSNTAINVRLLEWKEGIKNERSKILLSHFHVMNQETVISICQKSFYSIYNLLYLC